MPDESDSARRREVQERREQEEQDLATHTTDPEERRIHERRSEKAAYLREKLTEQERNPDE